MKRDLDKLAEKRTNLHRRHASHRPLSPGFEKTGLMGDEVFEKEFDFPMDTSSRPSGDGGVDFVTPIGTVDVKTAVKPFNLLVEENKVLADIYVLAWRVAGTDVAELLRWAWADEVRRQRPYNHGGMGVISHGIPAMKLRPLSELARLLADAGHLCPYLTAI